MECREDLLSRVVGRSQVYQWHQNAEEAKDVDDQHNDFDGRKRPAYENIDEDTQKQYGPKEQCAVPAFSSIGSV